MRSGGGASCHNASRGAEGGALRATRGVTGPCCGPTERPAAARAADSPSVSRKFLGQSRRALQRPRARTTVAVIIKMSLGPNLTGQTLDRRFRVERELGSGGMGTVWQVQHVESLQRYALKVLAPSFAHDPEVVARFLREARAAAALRTRHVVRIVDAQMSYVHAGVPTPFLVMELLEGGTLDSVVALRRGLVPGEAVWALGQVARALGAAHEQGIVHRDLKPTNVLVATDEEGAPVVKLCDFGIAKLLPGTSRDLLAGGEKSTQKELMLGSPMYMAPEQLSDARNVVPATDQWAFGLLAFYALTGRDYFGAPSGLTELVMRIARDPLVLPSELEPTLPDAFDAWFVRSCAREPGERFANVTAQMEALEVALGHPEPTLVRPTIGKNTLERALERRTPLEPSAARARRALARHRALLVLAAAASVALLAGWYLYVTPRFERALASSTRETRPARVDAPAPLHSDAPRAKELSPRSQSAHLVGSSPVDGTRASAATPVTAAAVRASAAASASGASRAGSGRDAVTPGGSKWVPSKPARGPRHETAPSRKAPGESCSRSAQCESGLCIAEVCR